MGKNGLGYTAIAILAANQKAPDFKSEFLKLKD